MNGDTWKCAGCGCPEPFMCGCATGVAYKPSGPPAWKVDVAKRHKLSVRFRWWLFQKISRFGWWVCPEPHRTRLYQGMRFDPNWKNYTVVPSDLDKAAE